MAQADNDAKSDAQQTPAVRNGPEFCRLFISSEMSEEDAKTLFDLYDVNKDEHLDRTDLTHLLLDICIAKGLPPVVPEEAVDAAISELCLNVDESAQKVSWIEFKSFAVYLNQQPLDHLSGLVSDRVNEDDLARALYIKFGAPADGEAARDWTDLKTQQDVTEALKTTFSTQGRQVAKAFLARPPPVTDAQVPFLPDAVVTFDPKSLESNDTLASALEINSVFNISVSTNHYVAQKFPEHAAGSARRSRIAQALATGVQLSKKALTKAKELDERFGVSKGIKEFDSRYKVTETAKTAVETGAAMAKSLDERYQVTAKATSAAKSLDERFNITGRVDALIQNPNVQKGVKIAKEKFQDASAAVKATAAETQDILREQDASDASSQPDSPSAPGTEAPAAQPAQK
eukprot:GABV01000539.1.p1 GENE.GABV01000539.1~~GABV01000539.1.p1  ORF type:complete len:403 (-),score=146.02 GABV01000539.1:37-1245(-)